MSTRYPKLLTLAASIRADSFCAIVNFRCAFTTPNLACDESTDALFFTFLVSSARACPACASQARAEETRKVKKRSSVLSSHAKLGVVKAHRTLTIAQKESALIEAARVKSFGYRVA